MSSGAGRLDGSAYPFKGRDAEIEVELALEKTTGYSARLQFSCLNSGVLLNTTCGQGSIDFAERND
jgi:hypothetical protein